jgi:hypothetical protein
MVKKYIVSKEFMNFELHIDGTVEIKPLPNKVFSEETIILLAEVHKTFIEYYRIKDNHQNLIKAAIRYFENKGFEVKEKDDENTSPPPRTYNCTNNIAAFSIGWCLERPTVNIFESAENCINGISSPSPVNKNRCDNKISLRAFAIMQP